jgi:hypothetical protein
MKLREIDWIDFFRRLPVWERLSAPARLAFAKMQPSQLQPLAKFAGDHYVLMESGFMTLDQSKKKLSLNKDCWPFAATIRLMFNDDLLGSPGHEAMHKYVTYQLELDEREALCESIGLRTWQTGEMEHLATSVQWLERFLACGASDLKPRERSQREMRYRPAWSYYQEPEPKAVPKRPAVPLELMKGMLRKFMSWRGPVPIADLAARLPELSPETLVGAVAMGVDRLLLFPGVRQEDMTLMLGLWPAITRRLHRPRLKLPAAVQPDEVFEGAFLMEDMTAMLVAASAQPLRLRRTDLTIFAKAAEEIASNLTAVPEWVANVAKAKVSSRIENASKWLRAWKLLAKRSDAEQPYLEATRRAAEWLAQTSKGRLKALLDRLRGSLQGARRKPSSGHGGGPHDDEEGEYDDVYYEESGHAKFLPFRLDLSGSSLTIQQLAEALAAAFAAVPDGQFCPVNTFLAWRCQEHNPYLTDAADGRHGVSQGHASRGLTVEDLETRWAHDLDEFLRLRLVPLGGVRLGAVRGGISFALTPAGRYLLGLAVDFEYGHEHAPHGQVIVQPNFEVMFLAPSPLAEAAVARIAERRGRGGGAMFQITKKSIFVAAGGGMTAEQALDVLQRISSKPLPANVAREVQGWFDQCRQITVEPTVLIRCPDADTAARVVAASGKRAALLTETVVELQDAAARTELVRKLHGLGIFVDKGHSGPGHRHGGRS